MNEIINSPLSWVGGLIFVVLVLTLPRTAASRNVTVFDEDGYGTGDSPKSKTGETEMSVEEYRECVRNRNYYVRYRGLVKKLRSENRDLKRKLRKMEAVMVRQESKGLDNTPKKKNPDESITNEIDFVLSWFKIAKREVNAKDISTQIGCLLEEMIEMLNAMGYTKTDIKRLEIELKSKTPEEALHLINHQFNHTGVLDALVDQIVVLIGMGYLLGYNVKGALIEVMDSNFSKFENGRVLLDANRKIIKGKNYRPPRLESFTNR